MSEMKLYESAPDKPTNVSESIAAALREEIMSGRLAPGSPVRQERVAEQFGASRIPVREALRILTSQGFLTKRTNAGARVAVLDLSACVVIYSIREAIEPIAFAESVNNLTQAAIDRLEAIQDQIEAGVSIEEYLSLDREFHLTTYSGGTMDYLQGLVSNLWDITDHYRRLFVKLADPSKDWRINIEHRLIIDSIKRKNSHEGGQVIATHIRRTRDQLSRHPELFGPTAESS
jgi:DNA-binding GntR family transcriptional regulator